MKQRSLVDKMRLKLGTGTYCYELPNFHAATLTKKNTRRSFIGKHSSHMSLHTRWATIFVSKSAWHLFREYPL